ncbi:hypothetical protein RJT34_17728 [Clitoria ternatea]|uniref:Uncharacterized protein n=1 Tax=Clitoria ternatea TaxID=43366 RepID=A0AAN9PE05_CLITE
MKGLSALVNENQSRPYQKQDKVCKQKRKEGSKGQGKGEGMFVVYEFRVMVDNGRWRKKKKVEGEESGKTGEVVVGER